MPRPQPKGWGRGGRCRRLQAVVESAPTDGERTCGWPTDASPHGMQYDLHTMDYDAIVVGAGPAGSTLARVLARGGVRVLLLDRASFPRDKPCGGGVSLRAASLLGLDLSSVTEQTIFDVRVSYRLGKVFRHRYPQPLVYMTQRCRLDALLADQAEAAGVQF